MVGKNSLAVTEVAAGFKAKPGPAIGQAYLGAIVLQHHPGRARNRNICDRSGRCQDTGNSNCEKSLLHYLVSPD
jgi:hypothetical protein